MSEDAASASAREEALTAARIDAVLVRLPPRLRRVVSRILSRWLGRTVIRLTAACMRVELFDRAMTIAAQFFSSVLPILILTATWADARDADALSDLVSAPESSRALIDEAVKGADNAAFGIVGTLLVLASATSLSRALTRGFAVIWRVPRPSSGLRTAWRWVAVVMVLTLSVVVSHSLSERTGILPPREVWPVAMTFAADLAVALFVPWVLLSGRVAARLLAPGAAFFGLVMLLVRPASDLWLPRALEVSADRYGPIGLAFTYLAWLYVVSFVFVGAAVVGQVITTDKGRVGGWLRGPAATPG